MDAEDIRALAKDAGRYRWLRENWNEPPVEKLRPWDDFGRDPEQLDAAIDAAIGEPKGPDPLNPVDSPQPPLV